jgi:multiple antibiotic resistance protein
MRVIMARVMGMILAAIAVEMVFAGIRALLPGLAH